MESHERDARLEELTPEQSGEEVGDGEEERKSERAKRG
jgi:hypothetical protein